MEVPRLLRAVSRVVVCVVALGALSLVAAAAGRDARLPPIELPAGPAKAGFELSRFDGEPHGLFETFHVQETDLLRDALAAGLVAADTPLLVTEVGRGAVSLLTEQMAYHHLAQGRTAGVDWLVSFCVVCNTGARFVSSIGGRPHAFRTAGVYDGVLVMQDAETRTLWHHITGDALYGPLVGRTLGPAANVLHMNVAKALARNPDTRIAISDRVYVAGGRQLGFLSGVGPGSGSLSVPADWRRGLRQAQAVGQPLPLTVRHRTPDPAEPLSARFIATLGREDARRPRMELGLGVWTGRTRRFYPKERIDASGGALIDRIDGRSVLVYVDPETHVPAALFVDSRQAKVDRRRVRLDRQQYVEDGALFGARGQRLDEERPTQVFTRWYGFALTFPDTEIYE